MTVFVTTHYLDEAEYCHRLALIHAGRLVALGTVSELKHVFAGHAVLEVVAPRVGEALEAISGPALGDRDLGLRHARARDGPRRAARAGSAIERLLAEDGNPASSIERILPSLEDVFIHHVEQAETAAREARS